MEGGQRATDVITAKGGTVSYDTTEAKQKKSITSRNFGHGMLNVSLLSSNATQLRAVLANPDYEFHTMLLWLIALSIVLQVLSTALLVVSDYYKSHVKEIDQLHHKKRRLLHFSSLVLVTIVTALNILISAFSMPPYPQQLVPTAHNHTEL